MNIDTSITDEELSRLVCEALDEDYDTGEFGEETGHGIGDPPIQKKGDYATDWGILGPAATSCCVEAFSYLSDEDKYWSAELAIAMVTIDCGESTELRARCWGIIAVAEAEE